MGLLQQPVSHTLLVLNCGLLCIYLLYEVSHGGTPAPLARSTSQQQQPQQQRQASQASGAGVGSAYEQAATANISAFRDELVGKFVPRFEMTGTFPNSGFTIPDWDMFKPIITCPPDRPLTKYGGTGDGSKLLCNLSDPKLLREKCVIYSLGSHGDFKFEQDMLKTTQCNIFTFDCTYDGKSIDARHSYYKWCVGAAASSPGYRSWANITQTLGHDVVDLLKMDIEGHEYPVLAEFRPEDALPTEISMEFHVKIAGADHQPKTIPHTPVPLGFVFLHLANLGYGAYTQEVNPLAPTCCCEFSFMRIPAATAGGARGAV